MVEANISTLRRCVRFPQCNKVSRRYMLFLQAYFFIIAFSTISYLAIHYPSIYLKLCVESSLTLTNSIYTYIIIDISYFHYF